MQRRTCSHPTLQLSPLEGPRGSATHNNGQVRTWDQTCLRVCAPCFCLCLICFSFSRRAAARTRRAVPVDQALPWEVCGEHHRRHLHVTGEMTRLSIFAYSDPTARGRLRAGPGQPRAPPPTLRPCYEQNLSAELGHCGKISGSAWALSRLHPWSGFFSSSRRRAGPTLPSPAH